MSLSFWCWPFLIVHSRWNFLGSSDEELQSFETGHFCYNVMILWILFTSSVVLTCLDSSLLQEEGGTALLLPGGSRNPSPRLAFVDTWVGQGFLIIRVEVGVLVPHVISTDTTSWAKWWGVWLSVGGDEYPDSLFGLPWLLPNESTGFLLTASWRWRCRLPLNLCWCEWGHSFIRGVWVE